MSPPPFSFSSVSFPASSPSSFPFPAGPSGFSTLPLFLRRQKVSEFIGGGKEEKKRAAGFLFMREKEDFFLIDSSSNLVSCARIFAQENI